MSRLEPRTKKTGRVRGVGVDMGTRGHVRVEFSDMAVPTVVTQPPTWVEDPHKIGRDYMYRGLVGTGRVFSQRESGLPDCVTSDRYGRSYA